jgi:hypothetical protein
MEIEIMNVRELSDFHTGYAYTPVSDEGDVYPSSEQTTSYDTYPWHSLDEYSGNQTVTQTCRPLPDFGCNETMFGIATYNATEKAEVLPLYAFNISTEQYGQQLDFTLCTEEVVGFSGYLAMYGSCASGSNDTFFGVPVNASETDGFCASDGRVLDVSVTRATGFNGLQFVISGGASGMASPYNELTLISGETYVFNQSGPTNHGYELAFSLNSEGTWDTNNGTEYDFEANGGELAYFVDNVKVNRSTYQKYIGTVHGAEWLDTYSSSAVSRLIRVVVPDSLPDAVSAVNIANGRDGKASLFYFSPNRKTMGGQLFIIGDEEMVTKSTFYFAGAPRFVFGLEGNSTYLPMEQGDSIEYAIRFECGSTPPVAATPSPTPIPTSEPTVEACVFEPFTCFDLFEGTTSEWPVGSEADAATTISQFSIPPSYFNTTLSFSSCILADLDVPEGVYWSLTETCSYGTTSARPDGRPIHRQHYSAGKLAEEAEYMVFGAVNDGNMSECFRHDGYAVDGFDDYAVVNTTMSFFFDVDEIPTFSLGLAALTNVNLTEALSFEVVTSCPSEPAECPYVDLSCGDTVYDMIDLNDAGEFRHKATYRLVLDDAVAGDLVTVSTCNPATTFDSFLSLLDDCPQRTTGATEYDLPVSVLGTNNDVEGTCPANELASELSFYYDDYAASSAGLAGNSSYYVLLEPFGNLANGANGSYALTVTCGVTPSPTPAPTTFVEDSCSYTETSCGEILMTSLEVFSSDVTESSTSHTTNTTETTVEVTETGVNSTSVAMEYEIVAAAPNWLREDITVQEVFDIEGSFECSVKSTTETVVNKVTEVTVTETLTTTYGTTGVELFTLNVTDALLDYSISFSTCSNSTNYDTHLSLYDGCPTANAYLDTQWNGENSLAAVNVSLLAVNDEADSCAYGSYGPSTLNYQFATAGVYYVALERYTDGADLLEDLIGKTTAEFSVECSIPTTPPTFAPTYAPTPIATIIDIDVPDVDDYEEETCETATEISCGECMNGTLPFLNATVVGQGFYGNETVYAYDSPEAALWNGSWFDLYSFSVPSGYENRSNITVVASTCNSGTTADTYMTLYDSCPSNSTANATILGVNNDDDTCSDTTAGASSISIMVTQDVTYYLAIERYSASDVVLTDPNATALDYVLCVSCDEEVPEVIPTPCVAEELVCGDVIYGYLGWSNSSNSSSYSYYDVYRLASPRNSENLTMTVHTCNSGTNFDTYLSAYDACPTNTSTNVSVIGSNDDADTCTATDIGASSLEFVVDSEDKEYYYLSVEKYAHGVENLFEDGAQYSYVLTVDCSVEEDDDYVEETCEPEAVLQCGDIVKNQIGYIGLSNTSSPMYDPDETYHIYQVNISDSSFWNVSIYAHTCSEYTTFDTYLSLYPSCPTSAYDDTDAIATNDDAESCSLTDAGASQLPFTVVNATSGVYYLMVERYAFGTDLSFEPGFNYTYELEIVCEAEEEVVECPTVPLQCGECVSGFLGYGYDNSTNTSVQLSSTAVESVMYSVNISESYFNTTVTATTCLAGTNFDTYLSLYDQCPATASEYGWANGSILLLAGNDDDSECGLSDSGASTFEYLVSDPGTFYLGVEMAGASASFEQDTSYDYELCLICDVDVPEEDDDEEFECPVTTLNCGDTAVGYLGYNMSANSSSVGGGYFMLDEAITHLLYKINISEALYNLTISASTCSGDTNFDTYVSLFDDCPVDPTANATLLASNDDDETCTENSFGASDMRWDVTAGGFYYLAVEQYAEGTDLTWESGRDYYFEIALECGVVDTEPPTPAPTILPTFEPTPEPTLEPTRYCDYIPVSCGDSVTGYLGYVDNSTGYNASEPTTYVTYGFTASFNRTLFPWYLFNTTVSATTCSDLTTTDTYVSLYDECPSDPDVFPMVLDANDDDDSCFDTNAGASTVGPEYVNGSQTFFVTVERFSDTAITWDAGEIYQYELQIICEAVTEQPTLAPTPLFIAPTEEPTPAPTRAPTRKPTFAPTVEPSPLPTEHECDYIPISCGEELRGTLAYNVTNFTTPETTVHVYGFNVSAAFANRSIYASTCDYETNTDTYVSIHDTCPTDPSELASGRLVAANDDDDNCGLTSSGASTAGFVHDMYEGQTFYYVAVERNNLGQKVNFDEHLTDLDYVLHIRCGQGAPTAPPTLSPTPGGTNTPEPTAYGLWYTADASTSYGAAGGDTIVFTGSDFKYSKESHKGIYRCAFVSIDGLDSMFSEEVTADSSESVTCKTPAWGSEFVSGKTYTLLMEEDAVIRQVDGDALIYDFYAAWTNVTAYPNTYGRYVGGGSAKGGEEVTLATYGLDTNSQYACSFYRASFVSYDARGDIVYETSNERLYSPATFSTGVNSLTCETPAWGDRYFAGDAELGILSLGTDGSFLIRAGARVVSRVISNLGDADTLYRFYTDWSVKSTDNLLGAAGGDPISFSTFGANEYLGKAYSMRFFHNDTSYVDSNLFTASSLQDVVAITPAWGKYFVSGNVTGILLESGIPVGRFFHYDFFEALVGVSPSFGSAAGDETISVKVFGAEENRDDYMCRFTSKSDDRIVMYSEPTQPISSELVQCALPSWGFQYVAEEVVLDLLVGGVAMRAANFTNDFTFEPVWTSFAASVSYGAAGGDIMNISAAGLNATVDGLERYLCRFTSVSDSGNTIVSDTVVASSVTSVVCETPVWGQDFIAAATQLSLVDVLATEPFSSGSEQTMDPSGGYVVSAHDSSVATSYFFYEAWVSAPRNASALGNESIQLIAFGLDASGGNFGCRFTATEMAAKGDEDYGTYPVEYSVPTQALSPTVLYCITPQWGKKHAAVDTELALIAGYVKGQDESDQVIVPNVGSDLLEFFPVWNRMSETIKYGAKGGDKVILHGAGYNTSASYTCRFDYFSASANGISLWHGVEDENSTSILSIDYSFSLRSEALTPNSTTIAVCRTPSWGSKYPEAITQVTLEEIGVVYDEDEEAQQLAYNVAYEAALEAGGDEASAIASGNAAMDLTPYSAQTSYEVVARSTSSVYNLYDFYSVFEKILAYPNDLEGEGSGDGGSASGNQTVTIFGYGFVSVLRKLYSIRFTPTNAEDIKTNITISSTNTSASNHTLISFVTPKFGAYFDSQLSTVEVVAYHPKFYAEYALPNPQGYYVVGNDKTGDGLGMPTFFWSRDWSSVIYSTQFGAKGGDLFEFSAQGLSANNTYQCLFTTGSASLTYTGEMMFSTSSLASSSVNVSCLSPAWGEVYPHRTTSLYLIERVNGNSRLLFNTKNKVPRYNFYESWDAMLPSNASAGSLDDITVSAYGVEWGASYNASVDRTWNYTCVFTGLANVTSETSPAIVTEEGMGVVPVMEVDAYVLTWMSTTTIRCELDAWGSQFPAMATSMTLKKNGIVIPEVSYDNGEIFTFDPDWASFSGDRANGARGGDVLTVVAAGLNASAGYECCFTSPASDHIPEFRKMCVPANVSVPSELKCVTPEWGAGFEGGNTTMSIEESKGAAVATPGRVVRPRTFNIAFEEDTYGANTVVEYDYVYVDTNFDFYPAIDVVSPNSGPAIGGDFLTINGYGLALGGSYTCVFTYTFYGTDGEQVFVASSAPGKATSPDGDGFIVTCTTPAWGDSNPNYNTVLTLTTNETNVDPVHSLDGISFQFIPEWTAYSTVATDVQSGAAGGDEILFTGSGFDWLVEDLYYCHFTSVHADTVFLSSAAATATSVSEVICVTPVWGENFEATNVTVELMEDTTLKADALTFGGVVGPSDGSTIIDYDFYPSFTLVDAEFGTASGNEPVVVTAFGITPQLSNVYQCEWSGITSATYNQELTVLPSVAQVTLTAITCTSPNWGSVYPGTTTFLKIVSLSPEDTGGYGVVKPVGNFSSHELDRRELTCVDYNDDTVYSDYCGHTYEFITDWSEFTSRQAYGAKGGDTLTFASSGLTESLYYVCRFEDGDGNVLDSEPVLPTSLTSITCVSPQWGAIFVGASTSVSLVESASNIEIPPRTEAASTFFSMYAAWSSTDLSKGTAEGGTTLTLSVFGLDYTRVSFRCIFTGQRDPDEEKVASTLTLATYLTSFQCVTPAWNYRQDMVTIRLNSSDGDIIPFVGTVDDYLITASWSGAMSKLNMVLLVAITSPS